MNDIAAEEKTWGMLAHLSSLATFIIPLGNVLGPLVEKFAEKDLTLTMITNRGLKIYPMEFPSPFYSDHWRCRYESTGTITHQKVLELLQKFVTAVYDVVGTDNLYTFDGKPGYTLGQGQ